MSGLTGRWRWSRAPRWESGARRRWRWRARGADVAVHYYANEAGAGEAARAIEALGRQAGDLPGATSRRAPRSTRVVGGAQARFGRIDILVNNAGGLLGRHALVDMPEAFFHDVMNVNVLTTFLCCQAVAPGMIARRHGRHRQPHVARGAQRRRARARPSTPPPRPPCSR